MKSPLIAAALLTTALGAPAIAGSSTSETFEMKIELNRAALDDAETIADEYTHLEQQIKNGCEAENARFDAIRRYIAVRKCVTTAMESTVQSIDHADLTRFHKEKRLG